MKSNNLEEKWKKIIAMNTLHSVKIIHNHLFTIYQIVSFSYKEKTCMDMHNEDIACHSIENKLSTHLQMSAPQRIAHYGKWVALNQLKILLLIVHT
jgi:hypothetical protein